MTAYAAHGRLHMGDRGELVGTMVDEWWAARERGESVMQASRRSDVLELNERARERLVAAGLFERDGLDVRGVTIGVGDQVLVLRNDRKLGVINGTLATVTGIDRERGDLVAETVGPEPRTIRLPASFWNAGGRRRLALAYCRTIHKAQGATYHGSSFTLAGDHALHLEATHVALSRGTKANHLYYSGEAPPHEDHHLAEAADPKLEGLVAAVGRSRAQVLALDLLQSAAGMPSATSGDWTEASMTEAQVAVRARNGAMPDRDLTWVQASLLIDGSTGAPRGRRAATWLRENGASPEEAARVIERTEQTLRASSDGRRPGAGSARLEVLEAIGRDRGRLTDGETRERAALQRWQADGAANRQRRRRRMWAQQAPAASEVPDAVTGQRRGASRGPAA